MSDIVDIQVDLDPAGYLQGVNQIDQANASLQRSMGGIVTTSSLLQRSLAQVTPGRATIAGMTLMAREAAQVEQGLSGLSATSTVTGINVGKVGASIRQLAREMPLGYQASKQTVEMFTRMGVASAGSEAKIGSLAKTVQQLSGATGEGPVELARGMTDLARATGNNSLDPRRFNALADSLTTVSAQSGASATNVLAFSKSIAPMAQASGIGATGVLGIATAFSKLGEDGFGASTAINKMLSDMNRSVREGTPELKTYAAFVGKTASEFEQLFKSNPAEALTQVTEAIAAAGPSGPRMLEQIGIEGVRGTRSIQALVASGGLREATRVAAEGYGSGSTERAAEAAFGGLSDSLSELGEASSPVAEALGAPLLGPLTAFTDALKAPVNAARTVAESDFVQKTIQIGAVAAVGAMVAKNILGPLAALGMGRQLMTSSPSRALFAGWSSTDPNRNTFAARMGAGVQRMMDRDGVAGRGWVGRNISMPLFNFGARMRAASDQAFIDRFGQDAFDDRQARRLAGGQGGQSPLRRLFGGAGIFTGQLTAAYGNILAQQYRNAAVPMDRRTDVLNGSMMGFSQQWQTAWRDARQANPQNMARALGDFHKNLSNSTTVVGSFGTALKAHSMALAQAARMTGSLVASPVKAGIGAVGRGAGALLSSVGGAPALAIMGGVALWQNSQEYQQQQKDRMTAFSESSISSALDRYRESLGIATGPTVTHGGLAETMSKSIAAATKTFPDARKVTDQDIALAESTRDKISNTYAGPAEAVAQQVAGISPIGLSPTELQAIKVDLLRQRSRAEVEDIMTRLPKSVEGKEGQSAPTGPAQVGATARAIGMASNEGGIGGFLSNSVVPFIQWGTSNDRWNAPNDWLWRNQLTEDQRSQTQTGISDVIAGRFESQSGTYEGQYAAQERNKAIDEAYKEAVATGNISLVEELSKQMSAMLVGKDKATYLKPGVVDQAGGSFVAALAQQDPDFAKNYQAFLEAQKAQPGGQFAPVLKQGYVAQIAAGISPTFANFFDSRQFGGVQQAVRASMQQPGDVSKQTVAVTAMVDAARTAGKSMEDLAVEAQRLAGTMDATDQSFALVLGAQKRAEFEMSKEAIGMTDSEALMQRYNYTRRIAETPPSNNPEIEANRQAMEQENVSILNQMAQRMKARLQMQRQYEVQVARLEEDANRQREYAQQDYSRQVERTLKAFNIQRREQAYQYNLGIRRSEEDFNTQRLRTLRDFNIQAERAERDYLRSRSRQIRDFNIQLRRQIEDAAASLLDPYTRIQTKATWDAKNLIVNLREQTEALAKQARQLDQLRSLGLSASAVDQLGLGKAENAQQVNNLVADAAVDPAVIQQLNQIAALRAKASEGLFTDESNKDLRRMQEDFSKALRDQAQDYATAVKDNRESLARGLADSQRDFNKAMARASQDYKHALTVSQQQLGITLDQMAEDYQRAYERTEKGRQVSLRRMREDLRMADEAISGDFKTLNAQLMRALNGQAVDWRKVVKDETRAWISDMNTSVMPNIAKVFGQLGLAPSRSGTGTGANSTSSSTSRYGAQRLEFAEGGSVPGYSPHAKADNILARLTAGEFVQPVDSVQHYGPAFMEALRLKKIPKEAINELPKYAIGGRVSPVNAPPSFPWGSYPSGGYHPAIDYAVRTGTPVVAPYDARVFEKGWSNTGYGEHLRLANLRGTFTILGHLLKSYVSVGQMVRAGQLVASSDNSGRSTGPHLHEEERTRAYDQSSAFNFLKGQISGVVGSSMLSGILDVNRLFAALDPKRDGVYGMLRDKVKHDFALKYDQGGIMQPGVGVHVNATGKPERVLTDEQWGGISELAKYAGQVITTDDFRGMRAGKGVHITVNSHDRYEYDYRNDFAGAQITVMSQDPDDMARKLENRQSQQRLTQTRGVRRD